MGTNRLHLGDPALDQDHAELQRLIDALGRAPATAVVAAIDALKTHAAHHFAGEDADLRRVGSANATCHLDEHAAVLKSLEEVRDLVATGDAGAARERDVVRRLVMELVRWLPEHVQEMDAGIASVRTRERFGGAPIQLTRRGQPDAS